MTDTAAPADLRTHLRAMTISVAIPLAVYYIARALGTDPVAAYAAATVAAAGKTAFTAVRERKLDGLSAFMMLLFGINLAITLATNDPRAGMVSNALPGLLLNFFFIGSCFTRKPLSAVIAEQFRPALAERALVKRGWTARDIKDYRAMHRSVSALCGVLGLAQTIAGVAAIYALPVDLAQLYGATAGNLFSFVIILIAFWGVRRFVRKRDKMIAGRADGS